MTFDLAKILESKRAFRHQLASRPIEEKLAMLDALRERTLAIRSTQPMSLQEQAPLYQVQDPPSG